MTRRHTVIESRLGQLTLAADDDALMGVYFQQHWHPPRTDALGHYVEPAGDALFRRAADQLEEYLAGQRTEFDLPIALVGEPRQKKAVGRNPLSIVVPCHRVVGKDGALTGYAGGLNRKRYLLDLEEPVPSAAGRLF